MKTVIRNSDSASIYLFDNDEVLGLNSENMIVGYPEKFIVSDCNQATVAVYSNVDAPLDWRGEKYLFQGGEWTPNPAYTNVDEV
jgi:hypothetical protein